VPMGGQVQVQPGESVRVEFGTWLDGMMDRVELVRGTDTIRRFQGAWNQVTAFAGEYTEAAPKAPTPYYIRVIQADGGMAWSSPVWVEPVNL